MTHPSDETLNDYIERELNPADHVRVAAHLETCAACAAAVAEIQHVVREASALGPLTPPPHVWSLIQSRVEGVGRVEGVERVEGVGRVQNLEPSAQRPEPKTQNPKPRTDSRHLAWALATAALVVMAFLAGRSFNMREQQDALQPNASAGSGQAVRDEATVRERVLLIAVGDHLERSQMVLVELAHAETHGDLDISAERQLADDLVASNRLYRQTAQQMGQTNVAGVLDELERVLVEVARGPSTVTVRQLAAIQQRIEAQGILFKVKVIGSDIRQPPGSQGETW